ncbi:MAG: type I DNA topoisomerase [Candidatus Aureabacteria bacterium]|nr:type I DNA topoisomerase [Candidatus Auribacterota bacterium]
MLMKKNLVIVESPAKAKTINKFLGNQFSVKASMGHVRDLPKNSFGIDTSNDFRPTYVVLSNKKDVVKKLKNEAKKADKIFLAPDPDREGEAIAWHLSEILDKDMSTIYRVTFNEITKKAVLQAFRSPGKLDANKINSQQARRLLDRIVGYKISPFLWRKVAGGLSAGRVQSVAVKLIYDREKEIEAFQSEEYWTIQAEFKKDDICFLSALSKIHHKKPEIKNETAAKKLCEEIERQKTYHVSRIKESVKEKNSPPPFITSTLQQTAGARLRWPVGKTMQVAQQLYEGIELGESGPTGLITYMRTDSFRVSKEFQKETLDYISQNFGNDYVPHKPNIFRSKKGAQEAHESIRPTLLKKPEELKEFLNNDHFQLYSLIWQRYVASQMSPSKQKTVTAEVTGGHFLFTTSATTILFDGYLCVLKDDSSNSESFKNNENSRNNIFPDVKKGDSCEVLKTIPEQHFTKPPARYTEATLVRALEEKGIGRPSTYAPIIQTIIRRNYVRKDTGKLIPTELGNIVTELLTKTFEAIINVKFTAEMEQKLDEIETGKCSWVDVLKDFYQPFITHLISVQKKIKGPREMVTQSDITCEKCGKNMVVKRSRLGKFLACPGFPNCKNVKEFDYDEQGRIIVLLPEKTGKTCPSCGKNMIVKNGRFGKFLACENYPQCRHTEPLPTGYRCPREGCSGDVVKKFSKRGRVFFGCSQYPDCHYMANSLAKVQDDINKKNEKETQSSKD